MDETLVAVTALIAVALIFDFINGFHDAANSIATVVSTRVLSRLIGMFLGTFNMVVTTWIVRRQARCSWWARATRTTGAPTTR